MLRMTYMNGASELPHLNCWYSVLPLNSYSCYILELLPWGWQLTKKPFNSCDYGWFCSLSTLFWSKYRLLHESCRPEYFRLKKKKQNKPRSLEHHSALFVQGIQRFYMVISLVSVLTLQHKISNLTSHFQDFTYFPPQVHALFQSRR